MTALPDAAPVHGTYTGQRDRPTGYLLYTQNAATVRILDGAAGHTDDAQALVRSLALQDPSLNIVCVKEPMGSPLYTALTHAGVAMRETQVEMDWSA